MNRLLRIGVPATVEHSDGTAADSISSSSKSAARYVAEVVQHFITLMDALKLNMAAVDQVHPLLADLMSSLHKIQDLPPSFTGKEKVKDWYSFFFMNARYSHNRSAHLGYDITIGWSP